MRTQFHRLCLLLTLVSSGFVAPLIAADAPATAPSPHSGIRLLLPPVIYTVPGIEANLYFENVCLMVNPKSYVFDVDAPRGHQEAERWTYLPTDKDIGDYRLTLTVRDENNAVVATTSTIVRVTPADAGADQPLSLLCIGDSLTNASVYPQRILEAAERPANPKLTLIGTYGPGSGAANGPVKHEGYGGWTALRFATHFTDTARTGDAAKRGSPFLYAQPTGPPKLDFTRYCADVNGGKFPDRVTIFLGPNDLFSYQDETIDAAAEKMLSHFDQIVEMVRTSSPATRIGLMLPVPPTSSQDAFGNNYGNGQTRWQYKRNMHRLVEKMQERYGKREAENIDLVPTHINLDCDHNYPTSEALANAWATDKITRQNNSVHPAASGYKQIGDSVYCWLKATAVKPAAAK